MQRSIINQKPVEKIFYILIFAVYESLSSIYLFLPPLFAVLFILFAQALEDDDTLSLIFISLCLLIFEADKGYLIFSSIVYFTLVYKFIMPKLIQNFNCASCIKSAYVVIAYVGFFFFSVLLSKMFLIPMPDINYYIVYYIVIEFFLVSLL